MRHALLASCLTLAATSALAQAPSVRLAHSGRLFTTDDTPVEGATPLTFSLHTTSGVDVTADDETKWSASGTVNVRGGIYTVELGTTPFAGTTPLMQAFATPGDRFLGVSVGGTDLLPRLRVGAVPLALRAQDSLAIEGLSLSQLDARFDAKYAPAGIAGQAADSAKIGGKSLADLESMFVKVGSQGGFSTTGAATIGGTLTATGDATVGGALTVTGTISGDGSLLTRLNPAALSGTIPAAKLPSNVAYLDGTQPFTGTQTFGALVATGDLRVPASAPRAACSDAGALYLNTTDKNLYVCDGSGWKLAGGTPQAALSWSPSLLDFGSSTAVTSKTATLTNVGLATANNVVVQAQAPFEVRSTTCGDTLAAGANCAVTIDLKTAFIATGLKRGLAVAYSSAAGNPALTLTGTVAAGTGTASSPATSCKALHDAYPDKITGYYWLNKPGATDLSGVYETHCDMDTAGGGWTLVMFLNTRDASTRHYDDATFWTGSQPVGSARDTGADFKGRAFTDLVEAKELLFYGWRNGAKAGWAQYDLVSIAQDRPMATWFATLTNTTITAPRKANSGAIGTNGARTAGDAFIDNPHAIIVNSTYSPLDSRNFTRFGTNYADRCNTISCDGHNYGGWGGKHARSGWGTLYEGAQLNGYCSAYGGYGNNGGGNGVEANDAFTASCASGRINVDMSFYVR